MVSKLIDIGAKVDIQRVSQAERFLQTGEEVRIYKSMVCEIFENGELELLMPIEAGKLMLLSLEYRYEFVFYTRYGLYKSIGEVKERYKSENKYMVRIELHTPLSKFQRRQFYRLQCMIDMKYYHITNEQFELGDTDAIVESVRMENHSQKQQKACIVDISGGGVRFVSGTENNADSYILMTIRLNGEKEDKTYTIVGHIIQCERIEHSEITDVKYENRVEFVLTNVKIQEEIIRYIFEQERKHRKNR